MEGERFIVSTRNNVETNSSACSITLWRSIPLRPWFFDGYARDLSRTADFERPAAKTDLVLTENCALNFPLRKSSTNLLIPSCMFALVSDKVYSTLFIRWNNEWHDEFTTIVVGERSILDRRNFSDSKKQISRLSVQSKSVRWNHESRLQHDASDLPHCDYINYSNTNYSSKQRDMYEARKMKKKKKKKKRSSLIISWETRIVWRVHLRSLTAIYSIESNEITANN